MLYIYIWGTVPVHYVSKYYSSNPCYSLYPLAVPFRVERASLFVFVYRFVFLDLFLCLYLTVSISISLSMTVSSFYLCQWQYHSIFPLLTLSLCISVADYSLLFLCLWVPSTFQSLKNKRIGKRKNTVEHRALLTLLQLPSVVHTRQWRVISIGTSRMKETTQEQSRHTLLCFKPLFTYIEKIVHCATTLRKKERHMHRSVACGNSRSPLRL